VFERIKDWLQRDKIAGPATTTENGEAELRNEASNGQGYSTDQPIARRDQDRFNRWPFAKRIAETIGKATDSSSIIIGIYGPWGDGKTSTLALMETAWANNPNVIPIRFNSWQFGSEEQLLRAFFDTLADALGKSLTNRKEDIGKILKKYGAILSIASLDVAHSVKFDPGKGVVALGDVLSSVELETLRNRLETILVSSGKRAVVLVDDIDRLDRSEIHALFRLIKVSASFKNTSYVLAFDDEMVAAALGEKYGAGGATAGRNFLEKIVHVPLHLPPAEKIELRKMAFEGVDAVLLQQGIDLGREEIERFSRMFVDAIAPQMTTPRQAKRFSNAIAFAVPLLNGEANIVDLMIVEATRIFFPKLYAAIRDNPSMFLGSSQDHGDKRVTQLHAFLSPTLDNAGVEDKEIVYRRLLEPLFPRSGRVGYGSDWDTKWVKDQRICSAEYFGRYFSYSVPPGDVGDIEVRQFIAGIGDASLREDQVDSQMKSFADRRAMPGLFAKLRSQEDTLEPAAARRLAMAIAPHGGLLPKEEGAWVFRTTLMQGAILIRKLLLRLPMSEREALAIAILQKSQPLPFTAECFHWMRYFKNEGESERVVSEASEPVIAQPFLGHIRTAANSAPLYISFGNNSPQLFWYWKQYGLPDEMGAHLRGRLAESEGAVDDFLDVFLGRAWGMDSGISRRTDFDRSAYDRVADLIDAEFVFQRLLAKYGEGFKYHQEEGAPETQGQWKRHTASRFLEIHRFVLDEKQKLISSSGEQSEGLTEG
jgi:hypothetical protein